MAVPIINARIFPIVGVTSLKSRKTFAAAPKTTMDGDRAGHVFFASRMPLLKYIGNF
jgi:hypothetical protein